MGKDDWRVNVLGKDVFFILPMDMELDPVCLLANEAFTIISPFQRDCAFLLDEDSGLGMELDQASPQKERQTFDAERKSAPVKRHAKELENSNMKRFKRHKKFDVEQELGFTFTSCGFQTEQARVDDLINNTDNNEVDGPHESILPTIQGKHRDLKTISSDTMQKVIAGDYTNAIDQVTVIDCRYPYEYQGGHIKNAINIYTKEGIAKFLAERLMTSSEKHVLIFHCEFSSKRGPKLCRFLRSQDRQMNKDNYPRLNFPEIYLLEGGYERFFHSHKELCTPEAYKPMLDKEHSADLRHFRVKSKSWAAGDKPRYRTAGLQRLKLSF